MRILVTGGCGFIGSAVVRHLLTSTEHTVLNVDVMTYASTVESVRSVSNSERYQFSRTDITDGAALAEVFGQFKPDAVMHLAAESHVDRSIDGPGDFVQTNIVGTYNMLQAARVHLDANPAQAGEFRFHHISTDEVFGALEADDEPFNPATPYSPRSPYSASKAASDHLVRAWGETFGLPVVLTNCSNNYGAFQFPEKLVPLTIIRALRGESLPVYGTGENIRDWLLVDDHARALVDVVERGMLGETYLIGGDAEQTTVQVVQAICDALDNRLDDGVNRRDLISFVADRPGHDFRYAVDASATKAELGWAPTATFAEGIKATVDWYIDNEWWWGPILDGRYDTSRLGSA